MLNRQTQPKSHTRGELDHFFHEPNYITIADILSFVRRYFLIIAAGVLLGGLLAGLYVSTATPLFTARAQLLIDPSSTQVLQQDRRTELTLDEAHIQSQIEVIRSDTITTAVIKGLNLTEDPEFAGGGRAWWRKLIWPDSDGQQAEKPAVPEDVLLRNVIGALQASLDVRRSGVSHVINISVRTTEAEKSAQIANAMAEAYEQEQVSARANAARRSSEWLESRIHHLRDKLDQAARALQSFKSGREYTPLPGTQGAAGEKPTTVEALEATVEAYRKIYEGYFQAFTNALEQETYPVANARVINAASTPLGKSHPRSKLILAFGIFAGLVAGFGVAFLRHLMDGSVRTPKQIKDRIGLDCIARIPSLNRSIPASLKQIFSLSAWREAGVPQSNRVRFNQVVESPFSQFSGAVKALKTAVLKAGGHDGIRSLGVTSALPGEGKSTLSANLAAVFALASYKTLIIDADMHNSVMSQTFAPRAKKGLLEVLSGTAEPADCIVQGKGNAPDVLPVVLPKKNSDSYPYDLVASESMVAFLDYLRESYHIVLVDMPPLTPIADGLAVSGLLDGIVLAVEWGKTPLELLADVTYGLQLADASILGVVLTKVDESAVHLRVKKAWKYY